MTKLKHRILVVDDEQDLCEILKFNLETEGYDVDTANSAEEAIVMDIPSYNLLLLDVMMGEMSGFAMAKKLKADERTSNVPIIFLTARDTENDTVTGFNLGADDYISKPFSIREVLVRIRAVLRRTAPQPEESDKNILKYQGLELDLDSYYRGKGCGIHKDGIRTAPHPARREGKGVLAPGTHQQDMALGRARARPHR